jgi:peptide deformylase
MALRKIRVYGDPVLREVAKPIEKIDEGIKELAQDMIETMYANDGVGLAANQVGVAKRLFVIDSMETDQESPIVYINPVISNLGSLEEIEEGCLSIPDIRADVKRADSFDFEALDLNGEKISFRAERILARIILHELDHLEGKLFVDYLSPVTKMLYRNQLKQLEKQSQAA